jgi:biopolymer transport protein ExbD
MALRRARGEDAGINLTPMIDVVFLLVIFFMVGSKFSQREGRIPVNVPGVSQPQAMIRSPDKWIIEVTREGQVYLDGQQINESGLIAQLQQARRAYPGLGVVVRGDGQGTLDTYARVLSACRTAGVEQLDVAVQMRR